MKKNYTAVLLLIIGFSLLGCDKSEKVEFNPVDDFKNFVSTRVELYNDYTLPESPNDHKFWSKYRVRIVNLRYDISNNDSLINPYKAMLSFRYIYESSGEYDSKEKAESATTYPKTIQDFVVVMNYVGSEKDGWRMTTGLYEFIDYPGKPSTLTPEIIRSKAPYGTPYSQLLKWL